MTCGFGNDIDFVFVDFQIICGFYELKGEIGFDFIIAKAHYSHSQNTYSSLKFQQYFDPKMKLIFYFEKSNK